MHERSEKHKKNVERKLKDIRHKEANEKKESDKLQKEMAEIEAKAAEAYACLLYTSPSPRDGLLSRMPSSA